MTGYDKEFKDLFDNAMLEQAIKYQREGYESGQRYCVEFLINQGYRQVAEELQKDINLPF